MFSRDRSNHPSRRSPATLHGVVFDILVGSDNHAGLALSFLMMIAVANGKSGAAAQTAGFGVPVLSEMARPKRFELLTPRFVVWCSIQLSYGRVFREGHHGPDRPDASESGSETSRKSALATRSGSDWQGGESGFWQSIWPGGSAEMAAKRYNTGKLRPRPLVADALQFHRTVRNR